jgi:hypothetical protein
MRVAYLSAPSRLGYYRMHAAYLLSMPPHDAVLISVDGDSSSLTRALEAAEKLSDTLTFSPPESWTDINAAETAGRECAAMFSQGGLPWWDRRTRQFHYQGELYGAEAARIDFRQALGGDPRRGFTGGSALVSRSGGDHLRERWTVDGNGDEYQWSVRHVDDGKSLPGMTEYRKRGSSVVSRRRGKDEEYTFTVGNRFVCPALEPLAEAWAARREGGDCLIDVSSYEARGVTSRLIRRLPGEKTGPPHVLVIDDYAPRGRIAAYDEQMERVYDDGPGWRMERIENAEAARSELFRKVRQLIAD